MSISLDCRPYEPGYEYNAVMGGRDVGHPQSATLNWVYKTNPWNILTWRISSPRVHVAYVIVESLEYRTR